MKRFAMNTGLLSGFLFGVATPFSKLLLDALHSFQLSGLLYLGAAIACFLLSSVKTTTSLCYFIQVAE